MTMRFGSTHAKVMESRKLLHVTQAYRPGSSMVPDVHTLAEGIASDRGDAELIAACLDGDERAWHALIDRYKRLVYSVPIKWGISPTNAVDIFQAVWHDCYGRLAMLKGIESLRPWLVRVAIEKCQHFGETAVAPEPLLREVPSVPPQTRVDAVREEIEREERFRMAMRKLSPVCCRVIEHLFFQTSPTSYITRAASLELSEDLKKRGCDRCLRDLRRFLADLGC